MQQPEQVKTEKTNLLVDDGLEVLLAVLGDIRVCGRGLLLPRELLPHTPARDNGHHQFRPSIPELQSVSSKCRIIAWNGKGGNRRGKPQGSPNHMNSTFVYGQQNYDRVWELRVHDILIF